MNKILKKWLVIGLLGLLSLIGFSQTTQAARVEVDSSNPIVASNDLFIPKNHSMGNPNDATIEGSGISDYTLEGQNSTTPSESVFQKEYGSFKLTLNNRNDWSKLKVVVDHGTVATYNGQPVHVKLEYSNFVKSDKEKVKRAGDLLWSKINNSTLQLGFSDGSTDGLDLTKNVTVLEVAGLDLPDQETVMADYTEANKKSVCLMLPLGKFCEKFGNANKQEYTMEIFDEAWIFEKARGGKQILKSMQRVGRSFCNILVYSTQSVKDTRDDKGTSSFGTIFAFDWKEERAEILAHVEIENSEKNQAMLSKMKKGQCLFRDIYGRVAKLSVHNLFEEWDFAMKTVERTASSAAEEKFAYA